MLGKEKDSLGNKYVSKSNAQCVPKIQDLQYTTHVIVVLHSLNFKVSNMDKDTQLVTLIIVSLYFHKKEVKELNAFLHSLESKYICKMLENVIML